MWRARSTVDPCRRELAPLRLSSESRAARKKPSLARSCALGARSCPLRLAHAFENCYKSRVFERPLSTSEAEAAISSWLAQPAAGILDPGERHWDILRRLVRDGQAAGPLVMDAVLAAIALEHGATVCTTDRDFSVRRAQVDEPSRGERLTQFSPRVVRVGHAMPTIFARYRRKTTRMTMLADVESYSTKSRPCCLRVIDLDIILVDPWHA